MKKIILLAMMTLALFLNLAALENKWQISKSTHFQVYYKKVPDDFIAKVIDRAEDYYNRIAEGLGFTRYNFWLWDERAKIYIYEDVDEFQVNTGQPAWSAGCVSIKEKTIQTYPLASGFFDTLLPHELGHIIFREFVGFENRNIPLWLDEGVASYQEMTKRFAAKRYVRKALRENKFMPLDELTKINFALVPNKETIETFYLEAVSLVDYLILRFGSSSFSNFCRGLRDGKKLEEALSYAYPFKNITQLNTAWVNFLKNE